MTIKNVKLTAGSNFGKKSNGKRGRVIPFRTLLHSESLKLAEIISIITMENPLCFIQYLQYNVSSNGPFSLFNYTRRTSEFIILIIIPTHLGGQTHA